MGFFKDFKDDLSQAVNELSDDAEKLAGKKAEPEDDEMVDTLTETAAEPVEEEKKTIIEDMSDKEIENTVAEAVRNIDISEPVVEKVSDNEEVSDETAIITAGLKIKGDIESSGSIELLGAVDGNVTCKGKLVVSGTITGNSISTEFFADKATVNGDIKCDGPAKIGNGSVIVGNLVATSAVIAGAIKGDIDVHGPVIVDTSAIVMGNIKSKLVQINNGAVIEGYCSQCYSDNSPKKFFGDK